MTRDIRQLSANEKNLEAYTTMFKQRITDIVLMYLDNTATDALQKFSYANIRNVMNDPAYRILGCSEGGNPLGLLIEKDTQDGPYKFNHIAWMVAKNSGQGIGSSLLEDSISRSRQMGKEYVTLNVATANIGARNLYEKKGFVYPPNNLPESTGLKIMGYKL